ncbi:flagellar basal body P-ring formation chaperone FlgA [Aeromonas sp. FDAARGOS 1417]|uniref:flagellar basal body P-ring formation chaperone FlgA n=1 Tax=Aeromonas TaxID=642 RepID=UPI0007B580EB|nr:flagellar basal body P-ring formation chaperone FlgA [Aeromonas sp. FDAARGOS 1417]ANB70680.1 flagellar biosynthesis protein FlgA [Aeromonas veronii]QWZ62426.1 flagellar basal body P-ring formation chaperone FlgA [Aeromonas sp. FDAARGOS 1417]
MKRPDIKRLAHLINLNTARNEEVRLPVWKLAGVLWLLSGAPAHGTPQAQSDMLEQLLEQDARKSLEGYITQQGWPVTTGEFRVWLAPSVEHLPPCPSHSLSLQAGGQYRQPWGRRPYLIECTDPAWQVRGRVEVSLLLPVWVAARDIAKGQAISASDLVEKELDVSRIQRGFIPSNHSLLGHKSNRHLRSGQLIGELDLQKSWTVKQGEGVLIRAGKGEFSATTRGEALENGRIGDGIKVKNLSSGKQIQAWVVDKGEVETRF